MRQTTIFLQVICVAIGALFFAFALMSGRSIIGGLVLASFMFMAAALLGVHSSTNTNPVTRQAFKGLALLSALPVFIAGMFGFVQSLLSHQWSEALADLARSTIFGLAILTVVFDTHPLVHNLLQGIGLSGEKR